MNQLTDAEQTSGKAIIWRVGTVINNQPHDWHFEIDCDTGMSDSEPLFAGYTIDELREISEAYHVGTLTKAVEWRWWCDEFAN